MAKRNRPTVRLDLRTKAVEKGTMDAIRRVMDAAGKDMAEAAKSQAPVAAVHRAQFYIRGRVYQRDMTLRDSIFYAPFGDKPGGGLHAHPVMNVQRKKKNRTLLKRAVRKGQPALNQKLRNIADNLKDL